jgi:quinohemoprotein ethanol dehydrogenase
MRKAWIGSIALALLAAGCGPRQHGPADVDKARLVDAAKDPANWMAHGGGYDEQNYSALDQINHQTVGKLGLAWSFEFDTNRGQEATPLVVDGVLYTSTAWSKVYAIDGRTGKQLWQFDPQVPGARAIASCCDVVNRGVAVWKGRVYVGTIDGRLIAIDARTGKQAWSVMTVDQSRPYAITGAPRVFNDKVIIGNAGAELGVRGYVTAYDTATGKLAWRFYTVPGDPAKGGDGAASDEALAKIAGKTWFGNWYKYGGGGTAWDSIVYDPEYNQIYIGVGNGSPWSRVVRSDGKGDNLFLASIVAVDADTGRYKWHYQASPGDSWDYTSTQPMMLATLPIAGKPTKVLMQAPKNGFFYILDRATGKLLSAKAFARQTWVDHIDMATGRPVMADNVYYDKGPKVIMPSTIGAHNWQPMAYSPRTGLVYIPTLQWSLTYNQDPTYKFNPAVGPLNIGSSVAGNPAEPLGTAALIAWDPVNQREVWRVPQAEMINGGTVATAGDLVFAGTAYGDFNAYDAKTGKIVWSFKQPVGIMAGPASYSIDGVQYIAVVTGRGGGAMGMPDFHRPRILQPNGRLLVFKLDGKSVLPRQDLTMPPPNPPAETFAAAQVAAGGKLFGENCARCHAGLAAPDLTRSAMLPSAVAWKSVVIDGALVNKGMVSFRQTLKPEEAEAIRAYVGSNAQALAKGEAAKAAKVVRQ